MLIAPVRSAQEQPEVEHIRMVLLLKGEEWRKAPEGSQEDIWAAHYDKAMGVLQMSLQ